MWEASFVFCAGRIKIKAVFRSCTNSFSLYSKKISNSIRAFVILFLSAISGLLVLAFSWLPKGGVYRFVSGKMWGPGLLWIVRANLRVEGLHHIEPPTPCIFYANHSSLYDIPAICSAVPLPLYFISKREILKIPLFGWGMYAIGMIFVDRSNPERARISMEKAARAVERGKSIITFPEGTRSKSGQLQPFKKGTFHLAKIGSISLVPIAVSGTHQILPPGGKLQNGHEVLVRIGKPITSEDVKSLNVNELTKLAQQRMCETLDIGIQTKQSSNTFNQSETH